VSVVLTAGFVPQRVLIHCGEIGSNLADSEFALGEGPSFHAASENVIVDVPDLNSASHTRWPAFSEVALAQGVQAIHAFPLRRGSVTLGVLALFYSRPTRLDGQQFRRALGLADDCAELLMGLPRDSHAPSGGIPWMAPEVSRLRIHQATGMVAQQLTCTVEEALDRMRAYAFSHQVSLLDVADEILQRRLELEL